MPKIIDLTLETFDRAPTFPSDPKCAFIQHNTTRTIGYNITQIVMSTHQGTHVDAPLHFLDGGRTIDRIDLGRLLGPASLIDLSHKEPGTAITAADFEAHADVIGHGSRVIYRTGWDRHYPSPEYLKNQPNLTLGAAEWLAGRGIQMIGMDTPTPCTDDFTRVHQALFKHDILVVEGLANLDQLPASFTFIALPLRLAGLDGSPVRAVALV